MNAVEVLSGERRWSVEAAECVEFMNALPERAADLTFGSPPYCDARTYGIGAQRDCLEWVEWMLSVTAAAARATAGPVFWVAASVTRGRSYWPACEGLMWEWWKRGGDCQLYRPCAWVKTDNDDNGTATPGSGGDDYLRADWEYVICFKRPGKLAWADNTAMGHPPIYEEVGGDMSNRLANGARVNQWNLCGRPKGARRANGNKRSKEKPSPHCSKVKDMYTRNADGSRDTERGEKYVMPKISNPGNVVRARVGGGQMGSRLCHEGEAPYPEALVEFFALSFCPPGGIILDPFSGSGTTAAMSIRHGRRFVGCDLRPSQVDLCKRRLAEETPLGLFNLADTAGTTP